MILFDVGVVVVVFPGQTTLVLMRSEDTIPQPGQGNPYFVAGRKESILLSGMTFNRR